MPIGAPDETHVGKIEHQKRRQKLPGCPELALATTSAASVRMVAIETSSVGWGINSDMSLAKDEDLVI